MCVWGGGVVCACVCVFRCVVVISRQKHSLVSLKSTVGLVFNHKLKTTQKCWRFTVEIFYRRKSQTIT